MAASIKQQIPEWSWLGWRRFSTVFMLMNNSQCILTLSHFRPDSTVAALLCQNIMNKSHKHYVENVEDERDQHKNSNINILLLVSLHVLEWNGWICCVWWTFLTLTCDMYKEKLFNHNRAATKKYFFNSLNIHIVFCIRSYILSSNMLQIQLLKKTEISNGNRKLKFSLNTALTIMA